jgi:diadenosine tetraphosphate (Ap4A) HIT family hydrolase
MPDLESIILRQILKRATTPLTPDQILNEVRETGYPRVKAREVDKTLEAANKSDSAHKVPIPQREGLGWALTESYKRKLGLPPRLPSPPPKGLSAAPGALANPLPGSMRSTTLPVFGEIEPARLLAVDDLFAVVGDKFPISPGHTLIIARRPVARFQELTAAEKARLLVWIDWTQQHLASQLTPTPDAFNFGLNDGPAAGQTMPQFHVHVIPRYTGDVEDPRGGIRHVIPSKARYW